MNATILTFAKFLAIKAVKQEYRARGEKVSRIELKVIKAAALREHPELIERAAETVRNVPKLRALAEREERSRQRKR